MLMLPLWAVCALGGALAITTVPLVQEKFKADGFALAVWIKIFMAIFMSPFILHFGLPQEPLFYFWVGLTCVLYSISDVIYYNAVPQIGSGLMTRLLPSAVVGTFLLWFVVDPALALSYFAQPWKAVAIGGSLLLFVVSAYQIKRCAVSWAGVRKIWFVILAASIGPIFSKKALQYAGQDQGLFAYLFFQALVMVSLWLVFYQVKKPVTHAVLMAKNSIVTGCILGVIAVVSGLLKFRAIQLVDNPAFVSMILFTDCLWVLLIYKLIRRKEQANVIAGLGIVLSAVLIVVAKSWK